MIGKCIEAITWHMYPSVKKRHFGFSCEWSGDEWDLPPARAIASAPEDTPVDPAGCKGMQEGLCGTSA
jgi:hypothetical protein